nr:DUF3761 domain-containing protein [Spelaeibacter cavernicola]
MSTTTEIVTTRTELPEPARPTTTSPPLQQVAPETTSAAPAYVQTPAYVPPVEPPSSGGDGCSGGYINSDGNCIPSPNGDSSGATARCKDGSLSHSQHRSGTCSGHHGVAEWF